MEKLLKKIKDLEKINKTLLKENDELQNIICKLQDNQGFEICKYFNNCKSLKKTMEQFYFKSIKDCYGALKEYNGCSDPCEYANDYKEYYKEIFGYEYEKDIDDNNDNNDDNDDNDS